MAQPAPSEAGSPLTATASFLRKQPFAHECEPLPESDPPYFVNLFELHSTAVSSSEMSNVLKDYCSACQQAFRMSIADQSGTWLHNDNLQTLFDMPLGVYSAGEGWEKRKNVVKNFGASFMNKAATVCAGTLKYATVASVSTFERQPGSLSSSTFISKSDGLFYHCWQSASQARRFIACSKQLAQAIFELQLKMIHVPITSFCMYRGIIFSVSAMAPLVHDDDADPDTPTSAVLQFELEMLINFLQLPNIPKLHRGGDGRVYIVELPEMEWFNMGLPILDACAIARPEAIKLMPKSVSDYSLPRQSHTAAVKNFVMKNCVSEAAKALLIEVGNRQNNSNQCLKELVVSKTLHKCGVNLRLMYIVHEEIEEIQEMKREEGLTAGIVRNLEACCLAVRDVLQLEMVIRTVKEMMRVELRASLGEDDKKHVQRVNRMMQSLSSKKSTAWKQLLTIMGKKYGSPEDLNLSVSSALLKIVTTAIVNRYGIAFDKANFKFNGFVCPHLATTVLNAPLELLSTLSSSGAAQGPKEEEEGGVERATSPTDGMLTTTASESLEPKSPTSQSSKAQLLDGIHVNFTAQLDILKEEIINTQSPFLAFSTLPALLSPLMSPNTLGSSAQLKSSAALKSNLSFSGSQKTSGVPTPHFSTCQLAFATVMRSLVIERILCSQLLGTHIAQLHAACFGQYPTDEILSESTLHPPVPMNQFLAAAAQVWLKFQLETLKTVQLKELQSLLTILKNNEEGKTKNREDAHFIGRSIVQCGRQSKDPIAMLSGLKFMKIAIWTDVGLAYEYFQSYMVALSMLNVAVHTAEIKEALRYSIRVVERMNAVSRRPQLISSMRKVGSALLTSQDPALCEELKLCMKDSLRLHVEKFGPNDCQTGVAHCQMVFIYATAIGQEFTALEQRELKKYHYFATSMGSSTIDALTKLLASEAYNNSLSAVIMALQAHGENTVANRAMAHISMVTEGNDGVTSIMQKAVSALQGGAASRLQKVFRSVVKRGHDHEKQTLNLCDHAYRVGVTFEEIDGRHFIERANLESMHKAIRKPWFKEEKEEREKIEKVHWREHYESRRDARIREKEQTFLRNRQSISEAADEQKLQKMQSFAIKRAEEEQRRQEDEERKRKQEETLNIKKELENARTEEMKKLIEEETKFRQEIQKEEEAEKDRKATAALEHRKLILRLLHERVTASLRESTKRQEFELEQEVDWKERAEIFNFEGTEIVERVKLEKAEEMNYIAVTGGASVQVEVQRLIDQEASRRTEIETEEESVKEENVKVLHEEREVILQRLHQRIQLALEEKQKRNQLKYEYQIAVEIIEEINALEIEEIQTRIAYEKLEMQRYHQIQDQLFARERAARKQRRLLEQNEENERKRIEAEENEERSKILHAFQKKVGDLQAKAILDKRKREMKEQYKKAQLHAQQIKATTYQKRQAEADALRNQSVMVEAVVKAGRDAELQKRSMHHDNVWCATAKSKEVKNMILEEKKQQAIADQKYHEELLEKARKRREKEMEKMRRIQAEEKEQARERREKMLAAESARTPPVGKQPMERMPLYTPPPCKLRDANRLETITDPAKKPKAVLYSEEEQMYSRWRKNLISACCFVLQEGWEKEFEVQKDEREIAAELRQVRQKDAKENFLQQIGQSKEEQKEIIKELHRLQDEAAKEKIAQQRKNRKLKADVRVAEIQRRKVLQQQKSQGHSSERLNNQLQQAQNLAEHWDLMLAERSDRLETEEMRLKSKFAFDKEIRQQQVLRQEVEDDLLLYLLQKEVNEGEGFRQERKPLVAMCMAMRSLSPIREANSSPNSVPRPRSPEKETSPSPGVGIQRALEAKRKLKAEARKAENQSPGEASQEAPETKKEPQKTEVEGENKEEDKEFNEPKENTVPSDHEDQKEIPPELIGAGIARALEAKRKLKAVAQKPENQSHDETSKENTDKAEGKEPQKIEEDKNQTVNDEPQNQVAPEAPSEETPKEEGKKELAPEVIGAGIARALEAKRKLKAEAQKPENQTDGTKMPVQKVSRDRVR